MPAVRKPTVELEASGAFKNHPERARRDEPDTGRGIGPAPEHLTEQQRQIWDEIVSDCAPGVFQSSDRLMMESLCILVADFRNDPAAFGGRKYQQLVALFARCGMTPSDRSRVKVPRGGKEKKGGLASFR